MQGKKCKQGWAGKSNKWNLYETDSYKPEKDPEDHICHKTVFNFRTFGIILMYLISNYTEQILVSHIPNIYLSELNVLNNKDASSVILHWDTSKQMDTRSSQGTQKSLKLQEMESKYHNGDCPGFQLCHQNNLESECIGSPHSFTSTAQSQTAEEMEWADLQDLSLSEVCNSVLSAVMMRELIYEWLGHKRINVAQQWSTICRSEREEECGAQQIPSFSYKLMLSLEKNHTNDAADVLLENIWTVTNSSWQEFLFYIKMRCLVIQKIKTKSVM